MPRENSFSDSDGRSLTPDLDEEALGGAAPISPTYSNHRSPFVQEPHPTPNIHASASKKSLRSHKSQREQPARPMLRPAMSGKDRFRASVRKVMAMHRGTSLLATRGAGAEPGVDPRRASADLHFGHIKQDCVIEIYDYSTVRSSSGRMTNKEFVNLMLDPAASQKEPWVKVRWINIGGMSWDVIKAVSIKYDLHSLALEDVLHTRSETRSKAEYFTKHLFLRLLCHELGDPDEMPEPPHATAAYGSTLTELPRSSSPLPFDDKDQAGLEMGQLRDDDVTVYGTGNGFNSRMSTLKGGGTFKRRRSAPADVEAAAEHSLKRRGEEMKQVQDKRREQFYTVEALKRGERVNVKVSPFFIFLLRDGTVISLSKNPSLDLTQAISRRLQQRDTGLRASADPSLLVHSLVDLIVDKALEVIDEYHVKIKKFERDILLQPKISTVRNLHILSGDLILHKRTLEPIKTLVYGLRRYDLDRCAALVDSSASPADQKIVGFMSHKSKIYLADVYDHMEYILSSLDMFSSIAENLINYTFNMTSYEMNNIMRQLTLATIVFLPLTLLTGYFGMNFESMWSLRHSDVVFWIIALPVMAIVVPLFMYEDIRRAVHYIQKKVVAKRIVKNLKQA